MTICASFPDFMMRLDAKARGATLMKVALETFSSAINKSIFSEGRASWKFWSPRAGANPHSRI
jgi:hypothetical protein